MKNTVEIPKKGIAGLKAHFKDDFISGFSVSLIALPLCLGIAIASGVPPLAGLITAIVGGMIASRISGSFVTISGPAAGLIVITLGAAESMGGAGAESGFAGYPHALGAILIGGLIMALFGVLKVGKVGDYFPSAAVHGMLAAIGVIIMIKQFFPALGIESPKGEILEVAADIPSSISELNPYATGITLVTLFILIIHPIIRLKVSKMIPAPMWVLIFTIPMAMLLGTENLAMVKMPHNLLGEGGIQFPSFEKIATSAFWVAVVGVALVSAIESLLSAKAVDSLDPYKRKSNLDRDLIAMGAGSSMAAAIGGLPMISEIVRSSANVNNGAKTQWANFFHGSFLLIYLLIGTVVIEMIPISALAAMLVFTGFKLAHPKEFKHMYKIGLMELEIFVVTLIAVLATDLIIGIVVGIVFKYILLLFKGTKFNQLFKSRVTQEDLGSTITLKLEGAQIFSNYLSLKKYMDKAISNTDELILDFADVYLVDHTVMEHLEEFERDAKTNGKELHIINIEALNPVSNHPLAARDRNAKAQISGDLAVSHRTIKLLNFAQKNDFQFQNRIDELDYDSWDFYSVTTRRKVLAIENVMTKNIDSINYSIADIKTKTGAQAAADLDEMTGIKISGINNVPKFYMAEETFIDRLAEKLIKDDINFESHPEFSKKYLLKGVNRPIVEQFFNEDILSFFENHKLYLIGNGKNLFLRNGHRLLNETEINELLEQAQQLVKLIKK